MTERDARDVRTFTASDGYPLHVAVWPADSARAKGQVVVLHGVQSHSGWYHTAGADPGLLRLHRGVSRSPRLGGESTRIAAIRHRPAG